MHELSIAMSVVEIAIRHAESSNSRKINEIEVEIGELSGLEIESFEFCFETVCRNSLAEGAKLLLHILQGMGKCNECGNFFQMDSLLTLCSQCGSHRIDIVQGRELKVKSISVDDD